MNQTGTGQIMNLLSNDVICFDQLTMYLNYIWMLFMTTIIGIMWQKVGISSFVGIGTLLIIVLSGQGTLSFLNLKLRIMIAPLIDRKGQLMSEFIAEIQISSRNCLVMKIYAWEKPFSQIVSITRKEIKQIKFSSYVRAAYLAIIVFTERLTVYFTLITFYFLLMDEVNTRRFSENTPQLQFKSQKPKDESNAENKIDSNKIIILLSCSTDDSDYVENIPEAEMMAHGRSSNLHNIMFFKLLQARPSFHNNSSELTIFPGRILNRFSKDTGIMDEWLPKLMLEAIQGFCVVCSIMIMEAIINQWMLILIAVLIVLFFFAMKSYLKIGQDLKRLEGVMKSPIFLYVNAILNGLPTIRSSGIEIEKLMRKRFDELQDRHSGTWYLFLTCAIAFAVVADLIMCLFLACICFFLISMNETGNVAGSKAGLAISQSLILIVCLQYTIKQFSESMSLMTFVEKILQYTNLPKEEPITSNNPPPPSWPSQGQLTLKDNLNVSIDSGWKVGVFGRTGTGKSSLISVLFRLFNEGLDGEIKIDGRNISTYDDLKLWEMRQVELNDVILDHDIFSGGHNFSVGQRQLICLTRTILRNNRLLVLDEATTNIDSQ
ncbi:MRP4 protein, partial [Acromyrmex heyeri]